MPLIVSTAVFLLIFGAALLSSGHFRKSKASLTDHLLLVILISAALFSQRNEIVHWPDWMLTALPLVVGGLALLRPNSAVLLGAMLFTGKIAFALMFNPFLR